MKNRYLILALTVGLTAPVPAQAEDVTLTTYYPAPYGNYDELTTTGDTDLATDTGSKLVVGTPGADQLLSSKMQLFKPTGEGIALGFLMSGPERAGSVADLNFVNEGTGVWWHETLRGAGDRPGNLEWHVRTGFDTDGPPAVPLVLTTAGRVGIGTTAPAASAVAEMASTTRGFLPPRMTSNQREAVDDPAAGLVVFDTTARTLMVFNGVQWQGLGGGGGGEGVPIGTIVAWHKSATGTPPLPEGWVECNGQRVNDSESPYDGQRVPDLNHTPSGGYTGGGRFLRGSTVSGVMQGATHNMIVRTNGNGTPWMYVPSRDAGAPGTDADASFSPVGTYMTFGALNYVPGWRAGGYASRPVNMSVVWIMRVK